LVTWVENFIQNNAKKKKKKVEVQHIEIDEEESAYEEDGSGSPKGGG
jgi:hypothetical protein